jgi:hypothetical protein
MPVLNKYFFVILKKRYKNTIPAKKIKIVNDKINSFYIPNNSVSKPIDIYFKDENDDQSFYDKDDACMHAAVRDYTAGTVETNSPFHLSGPQVILFLNDFKNINLRLHTSNSTTCSDEEKHLILVKCAMQSILSKLANNGYIEKSNLLLQVRPRGTLGGPFFCMELNPDQQSCPLMSRDTIITHTYAYLSDGRMCIFLNKSLLYDHILKIKNAVIALTNGNTQLAIEEEPKQLQNRRWPLDLIGAVFLFCK